MKPPSVVLDTNILISALLFGGSCEQVVELALRHHLEAISSPPLISEFYDVIAKKFPSALSPAQEFMQRLKNVTLVVYPTRTITAVADLADNRVIEAAVAGSCQYIISGDKDLIRLRTFEKILIYTPSEFLSIVRFE